MTLKSRPEVRLVRARPNHVGTISRRMRQCDVEEVEAFGHTPKQALRLGIMASVDCFTAMVDGRPEAMLGLTPVNILEGEGCPWMLGTEVIYDNPRAVLSLAPKIIRLWCDSTRGLSSLVASRNDRAIRLLRRLGFSVGNEVTTMRGVDFVTFSMRG